MKVTELLNRYKLKTRQAIDEIGIVELINQKSGVDNREKITTGQVIKALILNGLGMVSRPLYLFSQFFEDKAIEKLLGTEALKFTHNIIGKE
jgi:hypothetical protein